MSLTISTLKHFQERVEAALREKVHNFGTNSALQQACAYALTQGGKRFRPALVLMMAEALSDTRDVMEAALAVEYFHTASLIADDLPCMDDDVERRGKPAVHCVFGEAVALLASYALISEGYAAIARNTETLRQCNDSQADRIGVLALEQAAKLTGLQGTTAGQYLDLFPHNPGWAMYQETVIKKTVSLFEISMVLGWLFGGGDIDKLPHVKAAAYHYGMAFQMRDDKEDLAQDIAEKRSLNAYLLLTPQAAEQATQHEISSYLHHLTLLNISTDNLQSLITPLI